MVSKANRSLNSSINWYVIWLYIITYPMLGAISGFTFPILFNMNSNIGPIVGVIFLTPCALVLAILGVITYLKAQWIRKYEWLNYFAGLAIIGLIAIWYSQPR